MERGVSPEPIYIINVNVANEEDGGGDVYQESEQMGRAKGTHQGG